MLFEKSPNINHLWTKLLVEELTRLGITYFCLSSGSRSTPLAFAVAQNKKAKAFIHFDERSSGFHALGFASATRKPVAVVTTSGTAVANLFPAVIEASKKKIPLIILTADRPPELRFTGANQTIDQVKIFGDYVRWFFDMPCPNTDIAPEAILTTIDQAVFKTQGELKGPVHINCMFREPLAPTKQGGDFQNYLKNIRSWQKSKTPYTRYIKPVLTISKENTKECVDRIKTIHSGVIAVGKLASVDDEQAILKLSEKLGWPVFADASCGLRLGSEHPNVIHYFDQILGSSTKPKIDGALHLGGRMTSKRWYQLIEQSSLKEYITVLNHPLRNDPMHRVTMRIQSNIKDVCSQLMSKISKRQNSALLGALQKKNKMVERKLDQNIKSYEAPTELSVARLLTQVIPENNALFISNSLPIREIDSYGAAKKRTLPISANRGASGIDGIISSAIGFANGVQKPTTVLIGDLAFLYDLNALATLKRSPQPLTFIVLNNDGGGIFSFLPVAQFKNIFEPFFGTPHGLTFEAIAETFDLNYARPQTNEEFVKIYKLSTQSKTSTIIEIQTSRTQTLKESRQCLKLLSK